jgi:hypothetical protein
MAKLYFQSEFGTVVVREDDDGGHTEGLIEITAEQGMALSLSVIGQMISNLYTALENGLPGPP